MKKVLLKSKVTCPCGVEFLARPKRIADGRAKYCSDECKYKYRKRPSGLTYITKVKNRGWFEQGRDHPKGSAAHGWKGNKVGYQELHRWVRKNKDKPSACEHCAADNVPLEWANKSREYKRDLNDWLALCKLCHRRYDSGQHRGAATRKYGSHGLRGLVA